MLPDREPARELDRPPKAKRPRRRSPPLPDTEPYVPPASTQLCGGFFASIFRSGEERAQAARDEALREAAATGDAAALRALLDEGADVWARDDEGMSPLHCAAVRSEPECVRLLLAAGALASAQNVHGSTPLHNACARSTAEVARLLVEAGAPVNAANKQGFAPLDYALQWNREDVVAYLGTVGACALQGGSLESGAGAQAAAGGSAEAV